MADKITVETLVNASIEVVWHHWTTPESIEKWNHASDDWHCPFAANSLVTGGRFVYTMASLDGELSFDFAGVYTEIKIFELIKYRIMDGREVEITFTRIGEKTKVTEVFDPENVHPAALQQTGWQAILDNFRKVVEESD
jgi:uncharacterized protein YndB with AHSA1/START domain